MRQSFLFSSKQSLLLMTLIFAFSLSVNAKKKPKPIIMYQMEVTSKVSEKGKLLKFSGQASEWDNYWVKYFSVENGTDERIFIEWENARILNSRIIFSDDRRISMGNPKADEAVSAHRNSISRDITGESYIGDSYIIPLFRPKDLKKNIGNKHNTYITIPIRYSDNTVEDFELCFSVWYQLPPQTE